MQVLRPEEVFKTTHDLPRTKHLNRVNSCVLVGRKCWNKVDIAIFEDCQWDSDDDMFGG